MARKARKLEREALSTAITAAVWSGGVGAQLLQCAAPSRFGPTGYQSLHSSPAAEPCSSAQVWLWNSLASFPLYVVMRLVAGWQFGRCSHGIPARALRLSPLLLDE